MEKTKKRPAISWVIEFAGQKKPNYILSVILAMCKVVFGLMPYLYMADIVGKLLEMHAGTLDKDMSLLTASIIKMAVFWLLCRICHAFSTTLSHAATFEVLANIRRQLTEKLSKLPLGSVLSQSSGTYKNIICERVDSIETTLAHIIPEVLSSAFVPVALIIYMMTINWKLTLISFICVPVGVLFFMLMMVGSKESYENCVVKTKRLNDTAVEYINGIEVIKAFGKTGSSYEKFVTAAREGADVFIDWMRRCIWPQSGTMSFLPATFLGVLPVGLLLVKSGTLTAGGFITGIILSAGLITPLVVAFSYTDDLLKVGTIFGEVTEILERKDMERPAELTKKPQGCDICLKDVTFSYKEKEVLHGVNMEIRQGEFAAIVGPSGSGKSTIARLIDSLWDVDSGSVTYGGVDIRELPLAWYMGQIAYVAQDNYLFDMSVRENIRLGRPGATDEDVVNAAKATGCHEFILGLENGYETVAGGAGGHLSGGERQRICIARAMLKDAPVVILDEATAYTDPENEALVQSSVAKLVEGRTLSVIAHRLSTITGADRIFVISDGNVTASGKHEELLKSCGLYKKMWEAHSMAKDEDADAVSSGKETANA